MVLIFGFSLLCDDLRAAVAAALVVVVVTVALVVVVVVVPVEGIFILGIHDSLNL